MRGLDHIVHCTRDFTSLRQSMAAAGFTLTPPAEHPFGTGNTLVQLNGFFLEFLHVPNPHLVKPPGSGEFGFAEFNRRFLDRREGVSMVVFESADARADQAAFEQAGLDTYAPFDFSRKAVLPGGEEVTVGFSLAFVTHEEMPNAAFFTCQQHAPEHFWKPEYQRHANTATGINEVAMVASDPQRYESFLEALTGLEAETAQSGAVRVRTGRGSLAIYRPGDFADVYAFDAPGLDSGPVIAGYTIEVENREVTLTCLERAGMTWRDTAWGHALGPKTASGAVMAFCEMF